MFAADDLPMMEPATESQAWPAARSRLPAAPDRGLAIVEATGSERLALQAFIAERFRQVYAAQVSSFMPQLFGLRRHAQLVAAFGVRDAASARLFLERYLDEPVESCISRRVGMPVARTQIAEVGHLAGAGPGALRSLIPELTRLLHTRGYRWLVFTGSARLCNGFGKLGLPLSAIAAASPDRLPEPERALWGSYYEHAPAVMLGDVELGERELRLRAPDARRLDQLLAPVAGVGAP